MSAPIVIVGAGIAGLALGLALKQRGVDAVVLERRSALAIEGAGIQIGPNGTQCLRKLGVFDVAQLQASQPDVIAVHDGASGRVLTRLPLGDWIADRHGAPYWVTRRADLVKALFDASAAVGLKVRFGVDVVGLQDAGGRPEAALADGTRVAATAVIGADGVWSRVRQAVFGDGAADFSGRVAARATLPSAAVPHVRRDAVSVWMAAEAHLVCYPVQRGETLNIVLISYGTAPAERWSIPVDEHTLRQRLQPFPRSLQSLVTDAIDWRQWPLMTRAPLAGYAKGHTALIGDAAHPMLPFLAQGAAMSLEDAVVLADQLSAARDDILPALQRYSRNRLARTQRVVRTAQEQGRIYHLAGPMRFARDAVLRIAPPALMMRRYDWLYGEI